MSTRLCIPDLRRGVDEAKDVVEDIPVLGALLLELEGLGEGHGLLGTLDLFFD